ncbi:MAG: DUF1844 domain-containing protein [Ignavibacteriaceae bacterium]
MQLVIQNQQKGLISLGKVKNPASDALDKNLGYAMLSIDTLDMLVQKTRDNFSEYEKMLITETIIQSKIFYVEK